MLTQAYEIGEHVIVKVQHGPVDGGVAVDVLLRDVSTAFHEVLQCRQRAAGGGREERRGVVTGWGEW